MGRVLVTGGAGFIGSHVADALIARGHEVHVLDEISQVASARTFRQQCSSCRALSSTRTPSKRIFVRVRPTHVYHLAAYAAEGLSHFIKRFNYTNNVIGSVNLLNASVRHHAVVDHHHADRRDSGVQLRGSGRRVLCLLSGSQDSPA